MQYDRLYVEFVYYFNVTEDYFECHEVMEELWLEEGRSLLYQGLLQVAVGLYHHRNDNIGGAIKLFRGAIAKLEQFPDAQIGIDLDGLLQRSRAYLERLTGEGERFAFAPFKIDINDAKLEERVDELRANPPAAHDGD